MNAQSTLVADTGLSRFHEAQADHWFQALSEIRRGAKRGDWMAFIFPQLAGLDHSPAAQLYAIRDLREAKAFLQDEVLSERLADCTDAVLAWHGERSIGALFGAVDAIRFARSMTLFEAANGGRRYTRALEAFFGRRRDTQTLGILSH